MEDTAIQKALIMSVYTYLLLFLTVLEAILVVRLRSNLFMEPISTEQRGLLSVFLNGYPSWLN